MVQRRRGRRQGSGPFPSVSVALPPRATAKGSNSSCPIHACSIQRVDRDVVMFQFLSVRVFILKNIAQLERDDNYSRRRDGTPLVGSWYIRIGGSGSHEPRAVEAATRRRIYLIRIAVAAAARARPYARQSQCEKEGLGSGARRGGERRDRANVDGSVHCAAAAAPQKLLH